MREFPSFKWSYTERTHVAGDVAVLRRAGEKLKPHGFQIINSRSYVADHLNISTQQERRILPWLRSARSCATKHIKEKKRGKRSVGWGEKWQACTEIHWLTVHPATVVQSDPPFKWKYSMSLECGQSPDDYHGFSGDTRVYREPGREAFSDVFARVCAAIWKCFPGRPTKEAV